MRFVFGLTQSGIEPVIYRTRGKHVNHYTTNAVVIVIVHLRVDTMVSVS
jgi:hypothetical protein